jgi:hypothetical protein
MIALGRVPLLALVCMWIELCRVYFSAIDPTSEGEEGIEGEDIAGEEPGQPEITGKPPLALASLLPYICICYGL